MSEEGSNTAGEGDPPDAGGEAGGGEAASGFDWSTHVGEGTDLSKLEGKTPADIVKEWDNQQSLIGRHAEKLGKAIVPLGEDATDEEREDFYKKLGRPDDVDGYSLEVPEGANEDDYNVLRKAGFAAGVSDDQLKRMHEAYREGIMELYGDPKDAGVKLEEAAKTKFGEDFPVVIENMNRLLNVKLGGDGAAEMATFFNRLGYTKREDVINIMERLHTLEKATEEGGVPPGGSAGAGDAQAIDDQISQYEKDNKDALRRSDPTAWDGLNKLMAKRYEIKGLDRVGGASDGS